MVSSLPFQCALYLGQCEWILQNCLYITQLQLFVHIGLAILPYHGTSGQQARGPARLPRLEWFRTFRTYSAPETTGCG